jgi:hypothetical protein
LKGTGFSPYINPCKITWALQAVEKLIEWSNFKRFVSGHDFSHAAKALESMPGFSPSGLLALKSAQNEGFSAASLAPEGMPSQTTPLRMWSSRNHLP